MRSRKEGREKATKGKEEKKGEEKRTSISFCIQRLFFVCGRHLLGFSLSNERRVEGNNTHDDDAEKRKRDQNRLKTRPKSISSK
jgi:hypothetical protein